MSTMGKGILLNGKVKSEAEILEKVERVSGSDILDVAEKVFGKDICFKEIVRGK